MNIRLLQSFPEGYTPNNAQDIILAGITEALEQNKKFIIINAPTATGKSFIAKTLANYSEEPTSNFVHLCECYEMYDPDFVVSGDDARPFGAAILTVTRQLQEQYSEMFPDGEVMKGKMHFPCAIEDGKPCSSGPCTFFKSQFKQCIKNDTCPYWNQMNKTVTNKCSFYSYSMFNCLCDNVRHKEFLICDEASELEAELVGTYTFDFSFKEIKSLLSGTINSIISTPNWDDDEETYYDWSKKMLEYFEYAYKDFITNKMKGKGKKKITKKEYEKFFKIQEHFMNFKNLVEKWSYTRFVFTRHEGNIIFQPYNVDRIAQETLFKYGETVILMSATIVNHKKFAEKFGIDDYYYIEAPSSLPAEKAPIMCTKKWHVNYHNRMFVMKEIAKAVEMLCEKHKGQKGIIHTHSMEILKYLRENMQENPRFLFREKGVNNMQLLAEHIARNDDTILVSPSMTHGVDLKGNLGEFQIIVKAPYLPLGDNRVRMKYDEDREWYIDSMLSTLIQMAGRCNRCIEDESVTYILDGSITDAIIRYADKLPKYFKDRIK